MKLFSYFSVLFVRLCPALAVAALPFAARPAHALPVADGTGGLCLQWVDSTRLQVVLPLTASRSELRSNYSLWLTPRLCGERDTLDLQEVAFRGRLNRKKIERSRVLGSALPATTDELAAGDTFVVATTIDVDRYPWMRYGMLTLSLRREEEGCCNLRSLPDSVVERTAFVPPFAPLLPQVADNTGKAGELARQNPVLHHISECRDYTPDRVLRKEHGALYIHFRLNKTDLDPAFRDNRGTLDRIVQITRDIFADTTSSVVRIQIIGLASPEGPVLLNRRLAGGRAMALQRYIQDRVPQAVDSLFDTVNGGEAWTELRDQIADSSSPYRDEMLRIIDEESDVDRRERRLKQLDGGRAYRYLADNVLSDQRNSGYIAICYDYKPDVAARVINAAQTEIERDRLEEALSLLRSVEADPRAHNALGAVLYLLGQDDEAERYLRSAAQRREPGAEENLRSLLRTRAQREAAERAAAQP